MQYFKPLFLTGSLAAMALAAPAPCATYVLSASGTVTSATSLIDGVYAPVTTGAILVGDQFSFSALFDPTQAVLASSGSGPNTAIYNLTGSSVSIAAGSYVGSFVPTAANGATLEFWNDLVLAGMPNDAQLFEFLNNDYAGPYPYDLPTGPIHSELLDLNAIDDTAMARNTTSILELNPNSSVFPSTSITYAFSAHDATFTHSGDVLVNISHATFTLLPLVAGVPEPATWATMLLGMAAIGLAMRRRQALGSSPCCVTAPTSPRRVSGNHCTIL